MRLSRDPVGGAADIQSCAVGRDVHHARLVRPARLVAIDSFHRLSGVPCLRGAALGGYNNVMASVARAK